jgi:Mlc titration factor MtfA (ptsG expression regulator)
VLKLEGRRMFESLRFHRARTSAPPLPEGWERVVEQAVPLAQRLSPGERRTFDARVAVFLREKSFEGCAGLELTEEMRVTVAAHACLLLVGMEGEVFPNVQTILLYPHAYKAVAHERLGPVTIEREQARAGEAWGPRGPLVLAWDNVQRAGVVTDRNVVLHEFAHALDSENGDMDGAPVLPSRDRALQWAAVLGDEFATLKDAVREGRDTDIDPYGATNPAEFFAVVTEAFFGTPEAFAERHPALYAQLAAFYGPRSYTAHISGRRPAAPRPAPHESGLRQSTILYALLVVMCLVVGSLRTAWFELHSRRATGISTGTVTGEPSEVARTGEARVRLDTGPEVRVGNAVGDYPVGTRVTVRILKSPILGRASYELALSSVTGPSFDEPLTRE